MQYNQQLIDQAFKLLHALTYAAASACPSVYNERIMNAKKRAYRRFLRRMGF